ncbi:DNA polymerase III, delta' subunit [Brucella suis 06-988-1656]|uniref:DNA polymerase III subunit delta' n=1 Tax=Brucella suis TaxID=29461 RepID=UPI0002CEA3D6|nr:DNA polymerase III subunit delta' [Brucella suis]AIB20820.1 DNA polymerase III delta prime subunit [Brucella suis bv. 2]AIB24176.1 DNA polymerase III delta prime subunit [Brucella suis bv. 2]AIB27571.1 DNA polymerase III delta prime subunit [Brucella suis bv. 2]ENR32186.1 DNA polymerase III, delta' subunit [Brucella suis F4/06-146]ENR34851.1 DNA polymerase III, delta' subunit [Brucella suis F5/03-2]
MIEELDIPKTHDAIEGVPGPSASAYLAGHDEIARFLAQAYHEGRMHHALLFEGPQGIGKATLAFHLAGHMLSFGDRNEAPETLIAPGFSKPLWRQIAGGMHPAVLHITRPFDQKTGKFRTAITVEEIRRVTHFLTRTASDHAWRIVIVDPADDMNRNAANALLKTLEEPPARALFILISHSSGRLLPTIRSRCQSISFKPLDGETLGRALSHAGSKAGISAGDITEVLLQRSEGSVRKALLLLAHGGLEISDTVDQIIAGSIFDLPKAQALGGILNGREAEVQYELFRDYLMGRIAAEARRYADSGQLREADQWARFWSDLIRETVEAETYNLDRRQAVVILLEKTHRAFRTGVPPLTSA